MTRNPVQLPHTTTSTGHALSTAGWLAEEAEPLALPADDLSQWRAHNDPASLSYIFSQPDLYWPEANVLVTGYRPG
jgi:hypothetical protein